MELNTKRRASIKPRRFYFLLVTFIFLLSGLSWFNRESVAFYAAKIFVRPIYVWSQQHGFVITPYVSVRQDETNTRSYIIKQMFQRFLDAPSLWWHANDQPLPTLHITLAEKDLAALDQQRELAVEQGVLAEKKNVDAMVSLNNQNALPVKLRLKGDLKDHFAFDKWSMRLKLSEDHNLFGMRQFSIQSPITRNCIGPLINSTTLHYMNSQIITPNYFFVHLYVNDQDKGIMAVEEFFGKELLQRYHRVDGVIVKFDESAFWSIMPGNTQRNPLYTNHYNTMLLTSSENDSDKQREQHAALGLMRGFLAGDLSASQVFDVSQMATFVTAVNLWGVEHGLQWNNLRFYYNPITAKLEPIPNDMEYDMRFEPGYLVTNHQGDYFTMFISDFLNDKNFQTAYQQQVLTAEKNIQQLMSQLQNVQQQSLKQIGGEFYLFRPFNFNFLPKQMSCLRDPNNCQAGAIRDQIKSDRLAAAILHAVTVKDINAYVIQQDDGVYLEIQNLLPIEVQIKKITLPSMITFQKAPIFPIKLSPTPLTKLAKSYLYKLNTVKDELPKEVQVTTQAILPTGLKPYLPVVPDLTLVAKPYVAPLKHALIPVRSLTDIKTANPFLAIDTLHKTISAPAGTYHVNGNLVVPADYELNLQPATTLIFNQESAIISYGALNFQGDVKQPIRLTSEANSSWQGLVILQASQVSKFNFVTIENTTGVGNSDWQLNSALTFYESKVTLQNCEIKNSAATSAIHIVRSIFSLSHLSFNHLKNVALSIDYSKGDLMDLNFDAVKKNLVKQIGSNISWLDQSK